MNRQILKLAIPNVLSNISVPLLSTVDVALMGGLSIIHLGAIGLATMIFNFFFWNFGFLRMGTTGLVAQSYGSKNQVEIIQILSKSIYVALSLALVIMILQHPIGSLAQSLLAISDEHSQLVWEYFNIRIWAAPATLLTYCLFGWLFGMQNSIVPMIVTIVINVINIAISYHLVVNLNWEISGAAYGTIIAEYLGLLMLLVVIRYGYNIKKLYSPLALNGWTRFLAVNRDLFIRTVALTSAFAFFYRQSAVSGELILATNVVMLQFLSWMSYGIDGFAYASESLVGRYIGSKDRKKVMSVIRYSFYWAFVMAMVFSGLFGGYGALIAKVFTSDTNVLHLINDYRWWLISLPIVTFTSYMWDGIFIGLTRTKIMRNSMLVSLLIYVGTYSLLNPLISNAIWASFATFLFIRGLILTWYWFSVKDTIESRYATN